MSIIGEAALSAFFQVLFDKLASPDLLKIFKKKQVHDDLEKWENTLQLIRLVLDDAEEKQVTSKPVKKWLDELEGLAYDADDILDEFDTEALRRKSINAEPSTSKLRKFIPTCCVGLTPSSIMFDANMRSKIEEINRRLQGIVTRKNDLQLRDCVEGRARTRVRSRDPETSLVNEDRMYGRDEDKKAIVDLLLSGESSNTQLGLCFSVIPILGMGGLGKTTLAQLVYNDDNVSRHFDLKAWVCVSEDYDTARVTKEILQDIIKETCNDSDLNLLQHKLKDQFSGKKFLLILDDVWNENKDDWSNLRKPFEFGAQGSKIIITTRIGGVTLTMGATQPYNLEKLSDDACLTIFTQNALGTTDFSAHPELEEIGRKILERCKGSPLAAKVLGGLLWSLHDRVDWERVLNNKIWDIPEEKSSIFPILKLSYQYLPSHLKRCFAYCSLFPKDYEFKEKELVLLWMAEGLVQETKRNESMEDLGGEYFRDLLGRSFFQQSSSYNKSRFVMHDLINDLARWAAGGLCYILEDTMGGNMQSKISTKVRHFSYFRCENDDIKKFEDFPKDMHLRTFLQLLPINKDSHLTNHALSCLLPKLRYLRVLSLGGYEIVQLPDSIGNLKHLRYFNLSNTEIRRLPESLSSLYKLQTLILKGCSALQSLPISNCTCLEYATIEECNSLTFISGGQLPSTLKRLEIRRCEKLQSVVDEGEAPSSSSSLLMNEENLNTSVLEQLKIKDCSSLKCISSSGQLPTALKHLVVKQCRKLESVADKLHDNASLEHLQIRYCEKLKSLPEGLHKLCHLIKLTIWDCSSLVSFPDGGLLPTSLRELHIFYCEKLEALHNLTSLHHLRIEGCGSIISFPEEGYPTNLTSLELRGVNICKQVFEWGLHRLTSLTFLQIIGGFPDWQSFPSEEEDGKMMMTLPTSLTRLIIQGFPNIVFLSSKGFQNLSALQRLYIFNCPKLEFLPEKGLPPSLLYLDINGCPLLKQHCKKGKGREWLKIANIPKVQIDLRSVFEVEEEEQ